MGVMLMFTEYSHEIVMGLAKHVAELTVGKVTKVNKLSHGWCFLWCFAVVVVVAVYIFPSMLPTNTPLFLMQGGVVSKSRLNFCRTFSSFCFACLHRHHVFALFLPA